jgi:hypothetical protein
MRDTPNITLKEVTDVLTQDSYYRKLQKWPLIKINSKTFIINYKRNVDDIYTLGMKMNKNPFIPDLTFDRLYQGTINFYFPCTTKLLKEFKGNIVAAGGAITKSILTEIGRKECWFNDIDFFFYNLTIEDADNLRIRAIQFLIHKLSQQENTTFHVKRNVYTTTLYATIEERKIVQYQFIHRIYPDISSIIGGFDISACMIAYDGDDLYTTPLSYWSIKNAAIIVDTKRRSTSFEYRLKKYQRYYFKLLLPGLSEHTMLLFLSEYDKQKDELVSSIKKLINASKYKLYCKLPKLLEFKGNIMYDLQKRENILPYLLLTQKSYGTLITTKSFNREIIEDRFVDKISDYHDVKSHPKHFASMNAQMLRSNKLHSVCSVITIDNINGVNDVNNVLDILVHDIYHPNTLFGDAIIEDYKSKVEGVRKEYYHCREDEDPGYSKNIDFYKVSRYFGELTPEAIKNRDSNEYDVYRDIMIDKMMTNNKTCNENLKGVKWITQNPGRQWTSSINPIIKDPREWYGKHYRPVLTGIPEEIENTLRLMRLEKTESVWINVNDDIFSLICLHLLKLYADDAWSHISI